MDINDTAARAISEKARAERLYLHYALTLAILFAVGGVIMSVLALGDHLDVITKADGSVDSRLVNAAPGLALCLAAALLFIFSKPRRSQPAEQPPLTNDDIERRIERAVAVRVGQQTQTAPARSGRAPQTFLHSIAESLADAMEQNALEALPGFQKGSERRARGPVNDGT